jgi:predicted ATPase with chaperone activity
MRYEPKGIPHYEENFTNVRRQRAVTIAAAGGHNLLI